MAAWQSFGFVGQSEAEITRFPDFPGWTISGILILLVNLYIYMKAVIQLTLRLPILGGRPSRSHLGDSDPQKPTFLAAGLAIGQSQRRGSR